MVYQFTKPKDPDATIDYKIDWSTWLGTDTISTSTWTVPDGITEESDSMSSTDTTIWLSGGSAGSWYELTNRIVTAGGRTTDQSLLIEVAHK